MTNFVPLLRSQFSKNVGQCEGRVESRKQQTRQQVLKIPDSPQKSVEIYRNLRVREGDLDCCELCVAKGRLRALSQASGRPPKTKQGFWLPLRKPNPCCNLLYHTHHAPIGWMCGQDVAATASCRRRRRPPTASCTAHRGRHCVTEGQKLVWGLSATAIRFHCFALLLGGLSGKKAFKKQV